MSTISSIRLGEDLEHFQVTDHDGEVWMFELEEDGLGWGAGRAGLAALSQSGADEKGRSRLCSSNVQ